MFALPFFVLSQFSDFFFLWAARSRLPTSPTLSQYQALQIYCLIPGPISTQHDHCATPKNKVANPLSSETALQPRSQRNLERCLSKSASVRLCSCLPEKDLSAALSKFRG
ncbi:uncharacterized protein MEPE_04430 [Melanopsichium pennsylvanicum]|uniref:Secreted protein n=1 Tax=Melanopsichium pennsylvanicum TaxID=63383 RepID=A0AAJ4XPV2_9BASI|nr:uncharacterized protein MEPE_04430 [Melanopsichium pennsylvanicum]